MIKMRIGIIGGTGKMGKWFSEFFRKNNLEVISSGTDTKLTNKELVEKSDAVIFSVPIGKTVEIIESVLPFTRKGQILIDLTSVKTPAVDAMMKSDCEVLGTHPMFGPFVKTMDSQTIVFCKAREREMTKLFEKMFKDAGAKIKYASPEEHDKMMAVVQGMTHFVSISTANSLMKMGVDVNKSIEYTSPVYRITMDMMGRILAQDPKLYAEIEIFNPYNISFLKQLISSSNDLMKIIEDRDTVSFVKYFNESASHMGSFKEAALKESNKLIGGKNG